MSHEADELVEVLDQALARCDGVQHRALRAARGSRSPNVKTGRAQLGGRPTVETLPLDDLMTISRCNIVELSRATGTPTDVLKGMRRHGVPIRTADRLACTLGYHPASIWGPQVYEMGAA